MKTTTKHSIFAGLAGAVAGWFIHDHLSPSVAKKSSVLGDSDYDAGFVDGSNGKAARANASASYAKGYTDGAAVLTMTLSSGQNVFGDDDYDQGYRDAFRGDSTKYDSGSGAYKKGYEAGEHDSQ